MRSRQLKGDWMETLAAVRAYWPYLTEADVAAIVSTAGERDALMRLLKAKSKGTYGQIEREVTEFELRAARSAYAARPSLGIVNDG